MEKAFKHVLVSLTVTDNLLPNPIIVLGHFCKPLEDKIRVLDCRSTAVDLPKNK